MPGVQETVLRSKEKGGQQIEHGPMIVHQATYVYHGYGQSTIIIQTFILWFLHVWHCVFIC